MTAEETESITIRLPKGYLEVLRGWARADRRSLNQEILFLIFGGDDPTKRPDVTLPDGQRIKSKTG